MVTKLGYASFSLRGLGPSESILISNFIHYDTQTKVHT
nr:MAG TPA: hypothetical protein [Caudoviricetes sp.]